MNRRDFFKRLAATAVISAGGIALIEPSKTFFLPPRCGWNGYSMREIRGYDVSSDALMTRYDMLWLKPSGDRVQYTVNHPHTGWIDYPNFRDRAQEMRAEALAKFEEISHREGLWRYPIVPLDLPQGVDWAARISG